MSAIGTLTIHHKLKVSVAVHITVTNGLSRIVNRYFESKYTKPSCNALHCYSHFPKQEYGNE
jgi:hypothetical protein